MTLGHQTELEKVLSLVAIAATVLHEEQKEHCWSVRKMAFSRPLLCVLCTKQAESGQHKG